MSARTIAEYAATLDWNIRNEVASNALWRKIREEHRDGCAWCIIEYAARLDWADKAVCISSVEARIRKEFNEPGLVELPTISEIAAYAGQLDWSKDWQSNIKKVVENFQIMRENTDFDLMQNRLQLFFTDVTLERIKQVGKWGEQYHDWATWHVILSEEIGEAAEATLNKDLKRMRAELIDSAAVIAQIIERLDEEIYADERRTAETGLPFKSSEAAD